MCSRIILSIVGLHGQMATDKEVAPKLSILIKWNMVSLYYCQKARQIVRNADNSAGKGEWKKRMPSCNEMDSISKFALIRKNADFHLVFNHRRRKTCRIFEMRKQMNSKMCTTTDRAKEWKIIDFSVAESYMLKNYRFIL